MLNLIGKALSGVVLDRDARDAMREAGGLASTLQGAADMRAALTEYVASSQVGSTPIAPANINQVAMANSAALQAALIAQILASARATAAASEGDQGEPYLGAAPAVSPQAGAVSAEMAAILAQALATARQAASGRAPAPMASAVSANPPLRPSRGKRLPPSERAQLIQNALKVHSAKRQVLSNLSAEQRAKLVELATKLFVAPSTGDA